MFILIKKSCVESVLTWNKPVHVEMKAFQRGGAFCTSVNRKFNAASLQCVDLCVESKTRGILDARYMLTLYLLDLLSNKGTPWVSKPLGPSMDSNRLDMSLVVSAVPRVTRLQWSASSAVDKRLMTSSSEGFWMHCWIISARLAGFSKFQISLIPLEDALAQLPHEHTVQLMLISGAAIRKAAHEVPYVQPKKHWHKIRLIVIYLKSAILYM